VIADCHVHIFQNWSGACGHPSREIHWKYIQKNVTRPAARVRRARDGAPVEHPGLHRAGDDTWAGLRDDVDLRVGPYGRLEYTLEGEERWIQYMPVAMAQIEAPPEFMLAQMSYAGVDHCVLQAGLSYGVMNDYNALAQHQYPARFSGLLHVDEAVADTPRWMDELERARHQLGLKGVYYQLDGFARHGFQWSFNDKRFDGFWETLAAMGIPVFVEAQAVPGYDEPSYIANMQRLDGLLTRFPRMRWLLVMGPPVAFFARRGHWHFPEEVARVYARGNLQMEIMFPISWGGVWDYPYPEAQALIKDLRDRYGAEKLLWGSDMPNVERFCTYRQCLDYVRRYCEFLTAREKDLILGDNVAELCGIGKVDAA
jgi:predicted TIM-barrel fold metal-dependent hydrolase